MSASASPAAFRSRRTIGAIAAALGAALVCAVLFRASLATVILRHYLAYQGMDSELVVDAIGPGGLTAHGALAQGDALQLSFARLDLTFDHGRVSAVVLDRPVLHVDLRAMPSGGTQSDLLADKRITINGARISAITSAGVIAMDGDARIVDGKPQFVHAVLHPARLRRGALSLVLKSATLDGTATPAGMRIRLRASGDGVARAAFRDLHLALDIPALQWNDTAGTTAAATISLTATMMGRDGPAPVALQAQFAKTQLAYRDGAFSSSGDVKLSGQGSPPDARALLKPLLPADLLDAYASALRSVAVTAHLSWQQSQRGTTLHLIEPGELRGGDGLLLRLAEAEGSFDGSALRGRLTADLRAPGISGLNLTIPAISWSNGTLDGSVSLKGGISTAAWRGVEFDGEAALRRRDGVFAVSLKRCAAVRLAAYGSGRQRLITAASGTLCAAGNEPLFSLSQAGWTLQARALDVDAGASGMTLSHGAAELFLAGGGAAPQSGLIVLSATVSGSNSIASEQVSGRLIIADTLVRGRFDLATGRRGDAIGTVALLYRIPTGQGHAELDFPSLAFSPGGLQPADLSPLLSPLGQAQGSARFNGHVDWKGRHMTSGGTLDVEGLRFVSPLGVAQRLETHMVFTSLLPLKTAPEQRMALERVDWLLPLTRSSTQVSLAPGTLRIANTRTDVAGGEVSLTPLSIAFTPGQTVHGTVRLSRVELGRLIAASNLGEKLQLDGSVSGTLPFSFGPEGWRFAKGRIESDGPGRLSISSKLWGRSEPNAVEKAAYQALENLAYQSLSATVDSVAGGRLHVVFRIVGYDDSPTAPPAQFNLFDLLSGKAFQKQLPIPRGTPVNLTLDTSLNFDELLRGYQTAWSQLNAQAGASP